MSEAQPVSPEDLRKNAFKQLIGIYRSPVVGASDESIQRRSNTALHLESADKEGNLYADYLFDSTKYKMQMWEIKDPFDQQVWERAVERTRDLDGQITELDNRIARAHLKNHLIIKLAGIFRR